ncbi:type I-F CRISPR-associated protein Csy1 [Gemmatimonas sp.]|uniref:type I-F CRISPR-associated protein Csy1 n=1 Tax=Gemmatimonas sp. TaxID=1962908 RepID=UPI00286E715D|nr:type I-F CRISPR-associated protein Csy1 [Gemmatimonas sp.]
MASQSLDRQAKLRAIVAAFLSDRLNAKLEKLADDEPTRDELRAQFVPAVWLDDSARRARQLQAVTHCYSYAMKVDDRAKKATSLFRPPHTLAAMSEVGTHALGADLETDVTGNAAALDVFALLKQRFEGNSLLGLAMASDVDLGAALSDDVVIASRWMEAFAGLATARGELRSHTLAKQLYWPVGADPHADDGFHLLAPLYPTSLVHRLYLRLQEHRFGDAAKAAREARKAGEWSDVRVHEYPNLAIQKLGGTKPQNISQLNSERRGNNYLLASFPPLWRVLPSKPLLGFESLFRVFQGRVEVRTLVRDLRRFLESDPSPTAATRTQRDALVEALLDELIQFTAQVRELEPGWSGDPLCELSAAQKAWLDPYGVEPHVQDVVHIIAHDFANWLNAQLRARLPVGDAEYLHWRKLSVEILEFISLEDADEHI